MDLLVIGAGPVGRALARGWSKAGHAVTVAVRDPADPKHDGYRAEHALVSAATLPEADATALAVPGAQVPALLDASGPQLDERLLVDATNTLGGARLHQLPLLSERLPRARVYRAFTSTGWENFAHTIAGERPDMLYAGPDGSTRATVEQLIADAGPRPLWLGDGENAAGLLDGMARLWFALALGRGLGRHLAVRVLTGPPQPGSAPLVPTTTPRSVTIVGRGRIGGALGTAFAAAGHAVTYAVRDRAAADASRTTRDDLRVADVTTALSTSEIIVLALPGPAVADLVRDHADALHGRLVIDAANVVGGGGPTNSAAVIATVPGARYARAFNSLGVENLLAPDFAGVRADMLFTSSVEDRNTVAELIDAVGLRPVWLAGGAEEVVDDVLRLWFALARTHGRHLAFRVLTENPGL